MTINPAEVTITVDNASKVFGQADPVFTGTVVGLVAEGDLGTASYGRTNTSLKASVLRKMYWMLRRQW